MGAGNSRQQDVDVIDIEPSRPSDETKKIQSFQDILFIMIGSAAASALLVFALAFIVVGGIWLFATPPVVLALTPLIPIIFAVAAWGGAGIGGGISGFCVAINNIILAQEKHEHNIAGWLALGIGLMGTFATAGAVLGTFIPVPVLGTLVGAASGAVIGVLIGAGAWALSGIIGAIVIAAKPSIDEPTRYRSDLEDSGRYTRDSQLDDEVILTYGSSKRLFSENKNDEHSHEEDLNNKASCTIF